MTRGKINQSKRQYSSPTLQKFGEMAELTKGGSGSVLESGASQASMENPRT